MKPIEDIGHAAAATKPLRLKRYDVQNGLPDPAQCVDCAILVNDRSKPSEPARLAIASGSGWDFYTRESTQSAAVVVQQVPQVDLTALAREALQGALPQLLAQQPKVIQQQPAPQLPSGDAKALANALLELSQHMQTLQRENAELMARVEFLEKHALGRVTLKETA